MFDFLSIYRYWIIKPILMREQIGTEYNSFKFKKYTITIDISTLAACVTKRTLKILRFIKLTSVVTVWRSGSDS